MTDITQNESNEHAILRYLSELLQASLYLVSLLVAYRRDKANRSISPRGYRNRLRDICADIGITFDMITPLMKVSEVVDGLNVRADEMPQDVLLAIWRAKPDRWPDVFDELQVRASSGASVTTETVKAVIDDLEAWKRKPRSKNIDLEPANSDRSGDVSATDGKQKDQEDPVSHPNTEDQPNRREAVLSDGPSTFDASEILDHEINPVSENVLSPDTVGEEAAETAEQNDGEESNDACGADGDVHAVQKSHQVAEEIVFHLKSNPNLLEVLFIARMLPVNGRLLDLVLDLQQRLTLQDRRWVSDQLKEHLVRSGGLKKLRLRAQPSSRDLPKGSIGAARPLSNSSRRRPHGPRPPSGVSFDSYDRSD